jgi:hypothetical protein
MHLHADLNAQLVLTWHGPCTCLCCTAKIGHLRLQHQSYTANTTQVHLQVCPAMYPGHAFQACTSQHLLPHTAACLKVLVLHRSKQLYVLGTGSSILLVLLPTLPHSPYPPWPKGTHATGSRRFQFAHASQTISPTWVHPNAYMSYPSYACPIRARTALPHNLLLILRYTLSSGEALTLGVFQSLHACPTFDSE